MDFFQKKYGEENVKAQKGLKWFLNKKDIYFSNKKIV